MSTDVVRRILNFREISDSMGTAGQPTAAQLADIRDAGYEVVINLAMPDSTNALPNEGELVAGLGMDYVHIPVVWEEPTGEDLERFFETLDEYQGRKVFVHCALNWRVSAFVFLLRVIKLGDPVQPALQALHEVWQPNPTWQQFISDSLESHGFDL